MWILCEIAIAACDLAEVIGSAIGLNLLFGIPLTWGIWITALDVLLILYLQNKGFRLVEALVVSLIATIGLCFLFEIIISRPDLAGIAAGFVPQPSILTNPEQLYIAIGILGEYLSRVFDEVRRRPNYIVREVLRPAAGAVAESEPGTSPVSLQTRRGGR